MVALVGRAAELDRLRGAFAATVGGRPVTVLLSGEAGIGKTRLVLAATTDLPGDPLVLTGGCLEVGPCGPPYAPFVAILRRLVRAGALTGPAAEIAAWLIDARAAPRSTSRGALFEGMLGLFERLASDRPLVLVVEDLHWADIATRDLFVYLARNLTVPGLLLVGTVRTGELAAAHPMSRLLAELGRRPEVVAEELGPLSRTEVAALLTALGGPVVDPAVASETYARSGGNPLFVEALSDTPERAGTSLDALLLRRLEGLPDAARGLLSALAVFGSEAGDTLLAEVAGLTAGPMDAAVRDLLDRGQVVIAGDGLRIRHELIRDAVYGDLLPAARRELHHRCAVALSRDVRSDPADLARHWHGADQPDRAIGPAWAAAEHARSRFAYDDELRQLDRMAALWPRVDPRDVPTGADTVELHRRAATAALHAGEVQRGYEHAQAGLALLDPAREPCRAAQLLLTRARLEHRIDANGTESLRRALDLVPAELDPVLRARLLAVSAVQGATIAAITAGLADAEEALALADRCGDQLARAYALAYLGLYAGHGGDLGTARRRFAEATRAATRAEPCAERDDLPVLCGLWHSHLLLVTGRYAETAEEARRALDTAERIGQLRHRGDAVAANLAMALVFLGRWDEALAVVDDTLARRPPLPITALLKLVPAAVALARGEHETAAALLDTVAEMAADAPKVAPMLLAVPLLRGELALNTGDPERADEFLEEVLTGYDRETQRIYAADIAAVGARIQRTRRAAAPRNRAVAEAIERRWAQLRAVADLGEEGAPLRRAATLAVTASVSSRLADWDAAVAAARDMGHRYKVLLTLIAAVEAALADSNRSGARLRLTEAQAIARELGAVPALSTLEGLARRARLSDAEPVTDGGTFGLTAREVDVLRVLAQGRSNRQIAAELYVSVNTVGAHVARIYRKLSVNSRGEAVAVAHRNDLV